MTLLALATSMLIAGAAGHGRITFPPNRVGGTLEVSGTTCGDYENGTHVNHGCAWLADAVYIPGGDASTYTITDPELLTTAVAIANPTAHVPPVNTPWRAPGTAPVPWPCGCHIKGKSADGCRPTDTEYTDGLDLPPNPTSTVWQRGSVVEVAQAIWANHGGGWSWRLCPKGPKELTTEACFQKGALSYVGDTATVRYINGTNVTLPMRRTPDGVWSRNPIPLGRFKWEFPPPPEMPGSTMPEFSNRWDFSIIERVQIPASLSPGDYLLSWRWDCEQQHQTWVNCADVTITDGTAPNRRFV